MIIKIIKVHEFGIDIIIFIIIYLFNNYNIIKKFN